MKSSTYNAHNARLQIRCPESLIERIDRWRVGKYPPRDRTKAVIELLEWALDEKNGLASDQRNNKTKRRANKT